VRRIQTICQINETGCDDRRRGFAAQRDQRELERQVRLQALDFCRWTADLGLTRGATADYLGITLRTLRQWQYDQRLDNLRVQPLGRRVVRPSARVRNQVLAVINDLGPAVGLPTLQGHFPDIARAELHHLLLRYRRVWVKRYSRLLFCLHWQRPGSVWAMDFATPPAPIDSQFPHLLAVRDLASGQQLLWQPVEAENARSTIDALTMLFTIHGAPLVLKSDNGPAFLADDTKRLLRTWQVASLFSPPALPSYNGAIEAGIGSLKTRTHLHAARYGHPDWWTCDDAEAARLQANELTRPWGAASPTPDQAWSQRPLITSDERSAFLATVARLESEERQVEGIPSDRILEHYEQSAVDREAIRRALVAHGYLLFTRRRVPLPIKLKKAANIR